jgi:predicted site-specific integrase-resolvase
MRVYIRAEEACERLGITDDELRHLADMGKIKCIVRYAYAEKEIRHYDVDEYIKKLTAVGR